ncbi:hypothetical protein OIU77_006741 [Salix suchowensis]|uniref:Terpene synthase metal-binding domain-containing protein n=1 Tax=Salix suchowensis TaxID=1278906 RepID=A0ABQ9AN73_9ROSI|nr:hypothetical protein OIU77_006741 [Salix suchowensis]
MALTHLASSFCTLPTLASPIRASVGPVSSKNYRSLPPKVRCMVATEAADQIVRRSANYQSSTWEYDFVQSLTSKYKGEPYTARNRKLKAEIRMRLANASKPLDQLELIDTLQRLGLSYHFVDEIESILKSLFDENHIQNTMTANDLYATALEFRLLRQHGYKWAGLCKSYLVEAKWYYSGYTPSFQEYMDNAWISMSAPVSLVYAYFYVSSPTVEEASHFLEEYPDIIRWSSMIFRLADDLGTSSDELKRGDVSKSIQCYMHETKVSEEKARDHIKNLIGNTWKKINEYRFANPRTSQTFNGAAMNLARMAQSMYQYGDGYGAGDLETKDRVESILIKPL